MKSIFKSIVIASLFVSLTSCESLSSSSQPEKDFLTYTLGIQPISFASNQRVKLVDESNNPLHETVNPFNTNISITYYVDKDTNTMRKADTEFQNAANEFFQIQNAYYDRHHYYSIDGKFVNNFRCVNDSYGKDQDLLIPSDLYEALKSAVEFGIVSEGKFSLGIGNLSMLWDSYISASADYDSVREFADIIASEKRAVFYDVSEEELELALNTTPSVKEIQDSLKFNDDGTIRFSSIKRIDDYVLSHSELIKKYQNSGRDYSKPSLTLSAYAKGLATEKFKDEYSSRMLLINSGASSISCNIGKPDSTSWNISIASPYYNEALRVGGFISESYLNSLNSADIGFEVSGTFNLSTSGYYNNYYYTSDGRKLRHHIIDPNTGYSHSYFAATSVFMDSSGLADMYTTALMNCDSITEAGELLTKLNEHYSEDAVAFYQVNEKEGEEISTVCYIDSSLENMFYYLHDKYPSNPMYQNPSVTSIEVL